MEKAIQPTAAAAAARVEANPETANVDDIVAILEQACQYEIESDPDALEDGGLVADLVCGVSAAWTVSREAWARVPAATFDAAWRAIFAASIHKFSGYEGFTRDGCATPVFLADDEWPGDMPDEATAAAFSAAVGRPILSSGDGYGLVRHDSAWRIDHHVFATREDAEDWLTRQSVE